MHTYHVALENKQTPFLCSVQCKLLCDAEVHVLVTRCVTVIIGVNMPPVLSKLNGKTLQQYTGVLYFDCALWDIFNRNRAPLYLSVIVLYFGSG
ncbi:hypothetical protein C0J52_22328 [Blattella germanica]|nr:hypothetical protein C0J52_22328 [Blattella germanica]